MSARPMHKVAVVGGGPAGLATALSLCTYLCDVTVIERTDYSSVRIGEHLSPAAISSLRQLQASDLIFSDGHRPCHGMRSIWGEARLADNSYIFHPNGDGVNLSRPGFDASLAELARQRGVHVLVHTRVRNLAREAGAWRLELSTPTGISSLCADFLVDASGRTAAVARMLGQRVIAYDKMVGLIGFLPPSDDLGGEIDESLLLEAAEHGWWYVSHLGDGRAVGAYMTDSDNELAQPLKVWRERWAETTFVKERLRAFRLPNRVEVRSARSQRLDPSTGKGWMAVGDAAMSFDPLSSQGIAKGLSEGIQAAQAIWDYFAGDAAALAHLDVERYRAFREYLQTRATYYRMETRWLASPFWQRRHRLLPSEMPVTLDPMTLVVAPETVRPEQWQRCLEEIVPGIEGAVVIHLARSPQPAHDLVARLKANTQAQFSDQELIIAVQTLLAEGFLMQHALANRY